MFFQMPATIRHAFGATLGLRIIPELAQPPTKVSMHATEVRLLGLRRLKEIDFELTLEQ